MTDTSFDVVLSKGPMFSFGGNGKKTKPEMLARSLRTLSMTLRVGGSEVGALESTAAQFERYTVGIAYENAAALMRDQGASFSQAMLAQEVFPRTVRELILACPSAAAMHKSLTQAASLVQASQNVKKTLLTNMIQPGFMFVMCIVFLYAASAWIVPGILNSFDTLKAPKPPVALAVLEISKISTWVIGALILSAILGSVYWSFFGRKNDAVRAKVDYFVNGIPIVGDIIQLATTSRLFLILSANLATGRSEPISLVSAAAGCGSEALHQHCIKHAEKMATGEAKLRDFANTSLIPLNAQYMLAAAPSIRQEIEVLTELAPEYQKEADMLLDAFSRTVEPLMNYFVYSIAGVLICAVIIPMYSMFPALMNLGTK